MSYEQIKDVYFIISDYGYESYTRQFDSLEEALKEYNNFMPNDDNTKTFYIAKALRVRPVYNSLTGKITSYEFEPIPQVSVNDLYQELFGTHQKE